LTLGEVVVVEFAALFHASRYIDYFEVDNEIDRCFCIVQEEAVGESLGVMISSGMRCTDAEVRTDMPSMRFQLQQWAFRLSVGSIR